MHPIDGSRHSRGRIRAHRRLVLAALAAGLFLAACRGGLPAPDPAAPITLENLYDHEAAWPYRIRLVGEWRPEGLERPPGWGVGVLVRVEPSGLLRVDFASDGRFLVPAAETDVLEQANRIAAGLESKTGPNLRVALGTRLLSLADEELAPVSLERLEAARGYLLLYADPDAEPFREASAALGPCFDRADLLVVLVPQGGHRDGAVAHRGREAGWHGAFVFDRYAPGYTASLLAEPDATPRLQLLTAEGRLLFESAWRIDAVDALTRAIEAAYPQS